MNNSIDKYKSKKNNKVLGLVFIFIGLFTLDILFKGQIYQRLIKSLNGELS